jgi:hypothetical protein
MGSVNSGGVPRTAPEAVGLSRDEIDRMLSAFERNDLEVAIAYACESLPIHGQGPGIACVARGVPTLTGRWIRGHVGSGPSTAC